MTLTVCIGNGETREKYNLELLNGHNTYGCNVIARDWTPKHLYACDKKVVEEIVELGKSVHTRPEWYSKFNKYPFVKYFPDLPHSGDNRRDQPMHWGSGGYATYAACQTHPTQIYMLGFDIYSPNGNNNIYKGTDHYASSEDTPVDPSYWIYQLNKLHELYKDIEFIYVYPSDWICFPASWITPNVTRMEMKYFKIIVDNVSRHINNKVFQVT